MVNFKNILLGALAGAVIGTGASYFIDKKIMPKEEQQKTEEHKKLDKYVNAIIDEIADPNRYADEIKHSGNISHEAYSVAPHLHKLCWAADILIEKDAKAMQRYAELKNSPFDSVNALGEFSWNRHSEWAERKDISRLVGTAIIQQTGDSEVGAGLYNSLVEEAKEGPKFEYIENFKGMKDKKSLTVSGVGVNFPREFDYPFDEKLSADDVKNRMKKEVIFMPFRWTFSFDANAEDRLQSASYSERGIIAYNDESSASYEVSGHVLARATDAQKDLKIVPTIIRRSKPFMYSLDDLAGKDPIMHIYEGFLQAMKECRK